MVVLNLVKLLSMKLRVVVGITSVLLEMDSVLGSGTRMPCVLLLSVVEVLILQLMMLVILVVLMTMLIIVFRLMLALAISWVLSMPCLLTLRSVMRLRRLRRVRLSVTTMVL